MRNYEVPQSHLHICSWNLESVRDLLKEFEEPGYSPHTCDIT